MAPDAVVVGGGIVGTAAAAFLAEAGASVVLVEGRAIASAASGRNSGVVQQPLDPVLGELYAETVALYRDFDPADAFRLAASPAGLLYVTHQPSVAAALAAEAAASHPELRPAYLDGPSLQRLEPTLADGVAACRLEIGFPVAPAAATRAFAARAVRAGVDARIGEPARLSIDGDTVTGVRVGGRTVAAASIVVAAGPWTPEVVDPSGAWRPMRPLWGVVAEVALETPPRHVLEEAEIDETIEPGTGGQPGGVAFSLVTALGTSVVGSTFLDDEPDPTEYLAAIIDRGTSFVPALGRAAVRGLRLCARPLSIDGRPLVGRVPWVEGLFVAAGHGPWGISTGPAAGRMVAEAVLGRDASIPAALDPGRFGRP